MSLLLSFTLAFALAQSPATSSTGAISGQVVEDVTQAPVIGAQVTLVPARPASGAAPIYERPRMAATDQDGRYSFDKVEPGRYRIAVQKAGFTRPFDAAMPEVTVASGERGSINITLQRGAVIAGRVFDENGQPLVNVQVMPMRKMPSWRGGSTPRGGLVPAGGEQTNDLGEFRLHSLSPGEYYVQAMPRNDFGSSSGSGATIPIPTYFPNTPDAAAAQPINVGVGQTVGDIDIRVIRAPSFHVSGVVVDESGRPVVNAMVRVSTDDTGGGRQFTMDRGHQSRTDAAGRFQIDAVVSGEYTLVAVPGVVVSRVPNGTAPGRGAAWSGMTTNISGTVSGIGGPARGMVMTETRDGITTQYRDDAGTRAPLTVGNADVTGLEIIVRRAR